MQKRNVVVYNKKGGVGKTLICDELCYKLERENIPFNFISLDPQLGVRHKRQQVEGAAFTIVDMPGHADDHTNKVLEQADYLIVPFDMSCLSVDSTVQTINQCLLVNPTCRIVLVFNRVKPRTSVFKHFKDYIRNHNYLNHKSRMFWDETLNGTYPDFTFFNDEDICIFDSVQYQHALLNDRSVFDEPGGWRKSKPFDELLEVISKE